jgi:hypothetical protein
MIKNDLNPEQIEFVKSNYLEISIIEMASKLKSNVYQVRKVMLENNLIVDKETVQKFKMKNRIKKQQKLNQHKEEKSYNNPNWAFDFWNHNINPITMFHCHTKK